MTNDFLATIPEHILRDVKEIDLNINSETCLNEINSLLQRTVLIGGKRLRPLLTHLMGNFLQVPASDLYPYSRAVELVHAASLSHDDVIDNATMRRGAPSINIVSSNKKAVLAGDTLLASVIVDLCKASNLTLVKEMSFVIQDLSMGEWIQADLIESKQYTKKLITDIAKMKTSSVMSYCCLAPAILKGLSSEMVEECRLFGERLGLAFQLIDDTLDYNETSLKDQMLDLKNGVVNAVIYDYLSKNSDLFERFKKGEDLSQLISIEELGPSIDAIRAEAMSELEKATQGLLKISAYLHNEMKISVTEKDLLPLQSVIAFIGLRTH